jgi:hypothetical protein
MITSKFESDISDNMKKKWNCIIEVKPGAITVIPYGYDREYPVNLSRDKQFIENSKKAIHEAGIFAELITDKQDHGSYITFACPE